MERDQSASQASRLSQQVKLPLSSHGSDHRFLTLLRRQQQRTPHPLFIRMSVARVFDPLPIIDAKGTIFAFHEDVSRPCDVRQECGKPIKTNGRASREKR